MNLSFRFRIRGVMFEVNILDIASKKISINVNITW